MINANDNSGDRAADDLAAILAAHEFMLEVLWGMALAVHPPERAEAIAEDLVRLGTRSYATPSGDPVVIQRMQAMADKAGAAVEKLARKALQRSHDIRGAAQGSAPT